MAVRADGRPDRLAPARRPGRPYARPSSRRSAPGCRSPGPSATSSRACSTDPASVVDAILILMRASSGTSGSGIGAVERAAARRLPGRPRPGLPLRPTRRRGGQGASRAISRLVAAREVDHETARRRGGVAAAPPRSGPPERVGLGGGRPRAAGRTQTEVAPSCGSAGRRSASGWRPRSGRSRQARCRRR